MNLPFFYAAGLSRDQAVPLLEEDTMRHMMQVLRMQKGDALKLTNGKGLVAEALITEASKKNCAVSIKSIEEFPPTERQIMIAISPLKNASRFEWFLEKAAEIGISAVVPLLCNRTERQFVKKDRWTGILISAMLQSQQAWVTELWEPVTFSNFSTSHHAASNFIAHCMEGEKKPLQQLVGSTEGSSCILIGPEGDFTAEELALALQKEYQPVSLGPTRLRTETAALTAAVLMTHAV